MGGVVCLNAMLLEQFVGQVGAGFERELLRQAERVVAVEQDILDLLFLSIKQTQSFANGRLYGRHS
jgi:hypothetical protein